MLKASEILLETIKKHGRPERLLRQYEGATFYPPNPANNYVRGNRHRGMEPMKDLSELRSSGPRNSWLQCHM